MKATISLKLQIIRPSFDDVVKDHVIGDPKSLEIVAVFGKPTGDPFIESSIPLTVKEILIDQQVLDFNEREFVLKLLGGRDGLWDLIQDPGQSH